MSAYGRAWRLRVRIRRVLMRPLNRCWRGHYVGGKCPFCPHCGARL